MLPDLMFLPRKLQLEQPSRWADGFKNLHKIALAEIEPRASSRRIEMFTLRA